jgi:hypothetical protein
MRIVFCIWPTSAHQNPVVALAWSLKAAGHEAVVASSPPIAANVAAAGLTAVLDAPRDIATGGPDVPEHEVPFTVVVLVAAPEGLRGHLTRWLIGRGRRLHWEP